MTGTGGKAPSISLRFVISTSCAPLRWGPEQPKSPTISYKNPAKIHQVLFTKSFSKFISFYAIEVVRVKNSLHMSVSWWHFSSNSLVCQVICERVHIPDDVAGATLMALGCNGAGTELSIIHAWCHPSQTCYPLVIQRSYWKLPIHSWFSHAKWWFCIAMLNQRVNPIKSHKKNTIFLWF